MNSPISHTSTLFLQNDQPPVKVVIETALPFNYSVKQKPLFILTIQQTYYKKLCKHIKL